MAENYIKPEDVSPQVAQKVLDFLNSAQSAEEIASVVEIPHERDVGIIVAQHILDRRKELGKFANLEQVADVQQVGPERFTEIVNTLGGEVMDIYAEVQKYRQQFMSGFPLIRYEGAPYDQVIYLFDTNGRQICQMLFQPDDEELCKPHQYGIKSCRMYYRRSLFPQIIDTLRNEKPVFFRWVDKLQWGWIVVGKEPVGEEEVSEIMPPEPEIPPPPPQIPEVEIP